MIVLPQKRFERRIDGNKICRVRKPDSRTKDAEKEYFMNKKRLLAIALTFALVLSLVFAFAACTTEKENQNTDTEGTFKVVLVPKQGEAQEYTVDISLLDGQLNGEAAVMQLVGNHGVSITWEESSYGKYINSIGCVQPTEANEFVQIFTSVEKDKGVDAYAVTIDYKGTSLTTSRFGITGMSVEKDCIILIRVGSY